MPPSRRPFRVSKLFVVHNLLHFSVLSVSYFVVPALGTLVTAEKTNPHGTKTQGPIYRSFYRIGWDGWGGGKNNPFTCYFAA